MPQRTLPPPDTAIRLLRRFFFSREDRLAILAPWGKPCPIEVRIDLEAILRAHLLGQAAPAVSVDYRNTKASGRISGHFRVGSYTPAPAGGTRWMCIDFDGAGHADALADPQGAALATLASIRNQGLPAYLERSGGGSGWHLWCFFSQPADAERARAFGVAAVPLGIPLASGEPADPETGKGIEVFPKQAKILKKGCGNMVWLPWWAGAKPGCNEFHRVDDNGELVPHAPEDFETIAPERLAVSPSKKPANREKPAAASGATPATAPFTPEMEDAFTAADKPPDGSGNEAFKQWRREALEAIDLELVYGAWLTGVRSGDGWLQCRDPSSKSGDRRPSSGVGDGTGNAERGTFHTFRDDAKSLSLFDFMVWTRQARDFSDAVRKVAQLSGVPLPERPRPLVTVENAAQHPGVPAPGAHVRRPEIVVNNRQLRDIVRDAWGAVHFYNRLSAPPREAPQRPGPRVFERGGSLVRLATMGEDGAVGIQPMNENMVYGVLSRAADWKRLTQEGAMDVSPVRDVARDMLVNPAPELPSLETVITAPAFGRGGRLIAAPGFHAEDRVWLELDKNLIVPPVPERPTPDDAAAARSLLLDELLVDFPFVTPADRAHAMAAMLLPFCRRMIGGVTPLHLIEAPSAGTGKGLLTAIIALLATGQAAPGRTLPVMEDEARKMITSELAQGRPIVLLDNISEKRELDNPALASVITSSVWTDRILGLSQMATLPNKALWIMTANNPQLSLEIARRCIRVRIDARADRPWLRGGFRHDPLMDWARENRGQLILAILTLIQSWIAHGRPRSRRSLGSFEQWSGVIGGILETAGIEGFLGSLDELYDAADQDGQAWREFTASWWEQWGSAPRTVGQLNDFCRDRELMLKARGEGTARSQQTRLGAALMSVRDRIFGELRVMRCEQKNHRTGSTWIVVPVSLGDDGGDQPLDSPELWDDTQAGRETLGRPSGDLGLPPQVSQNQQPVNGGETWETFSPNPHMRGRAHARTYARTHESPPKVSQGLPPSPPVLNSGDLERETFTPQGLPAVSPRYPTVDLGIGEPSFDLADLPDVWPPTDLPPGTDSRPRPHSPAHAALATGSADPSALTPEGRQAPDPAGTARDQADAPQPPIDTNQTHPWNE